MFDIELIYLVNLNNYILKAHHQTQYFEKNLIKIDVTKIKKLTEKNSQIKISDFIEKTNNE